MILYNKEAEIFDTKNIQSLDADIHAFYSDTFCQKTCNIEDSGVQTRWTDLISHQPLITYRRMLWTDEEGNQVVAIAPRDTEGFIYGLPENILERLEHNENRVNIAGRWYLFIDPSKAKLYEMHPTIRNVIILLDTIFQLNIFQENRNTAFLSTTFNEEYLPKICDQFPLMEKLKLSVSKLKALNQDDYTNAKIQLPFEKFTVLMTKDDTSITQSIKGYAFDIFAQKFLALLMETENQVAQTWLRLLLSLFTVDFSQVPQEYRCTLAELVDVNLQDQPILVNIFKYALRKELIDKLPHEKQNRFISYIIEILKHLPEGSDYRIEIFAHFDLKLLQNTEIFTAINEIMHQEVAYLSNGSELQQELIMPFFKTVSDVWPGYYQPERLAAAQFGLQRKSSRDRKNALQIFISLVKEDFALDEAIQAAVIGLQNNKKSNRNITFQLIEELRKHGMNDHVVTAVLNATQ